MLLKYKNGGDLLTYILIVVLEAHKNFSLTAKKHILALLFASKKTHLSNNVGCTFNPTRVVMCDIHNTAAYVAQQTSPRTVQSQ